MLPAVMYFVSGLDLDIDNVTCPSKSLG